MDTGSLIERLRGWAFRVDVVVAAIVTALAVSPPIEVDRASLIVAVLAFLSITVRSVSPTVALGAVWVMAFSQMIVNERPGFAALAILLVLYSAARIGTRAEVVAAGVSAVVGGIVATNYLLDSGTRYRILAYGGFDSQILALSAPVVVLVSAWLAGFAVRSFRRSRHESRRRVLAEGRTDRALDAAEAEKIRADMARDVHDIVGHSLAVIIAQADSVQFLEDQDRIRAVSATIGETARRSLHEVREVLSGTSPVGIDEEPPDLDTLVEQIRAAGVAIERTVRGQQRALDGPLSVVVRRVAQEMLTNALRHGEPGGGITVSETWRSADIVIEVENAVPAAAPAATAPIVSQPVPVHATPAPPREPVRGTGLGISGMTMRLEAVGGTLEAEAVDGVFTARARVPLRATGEEAL